MEILSPASSFQAVQSAVFNGACAVYLGFGDFNARRNAKKFTQEEFLRSVEFCNIHNVSVFVTVNIILNDRELKQAVDFIKFLASTNITAVIVQDLGVLELFKQISPDIPVHASTQLTVHNLDGVLVAEKLGFKRVVLSRELSYENIKYICKNSPIETEVFVHGALCMSYSGQCYLSAMIGERSGNRGLCAQPCRLPFSYANEKKKALLSLKDLSLIEQIQKLKSAGVTCLKIEGRMKRAEYTGVVTKIYKAVLDENRAPTCEEKNLLKDIFSRDGFTQGYFNNKIDEDMFGTKSEPPSNVLDEHEAKTYPVDFSFIAKKDEKVILEAVDVENGNKTTVYSEALEKALNKPTSKEQIETSLAKTGGTVFAVNKICAEIDEGLIIRASTINNLRRTALENLEKSRITNKNYRVLPFDFEKQIKNTKRHMKISVEVTKISQITDIMFENLPEIIYIPLLEINDNQREIEKLINSGFNICIKLPKVITDNQKQEIEDMLDNAKKLGIKNLLVSNIGFIRSDFNIYGDFGLNIYNSLSLKSLKNLGVLQTMLSFELKTPQIRDISKCMPTEIFAYGYLPLMVFENCAIVRKTGKCTCKQEQSYLNDRKNEKFALLPEFGCRNTLLNNKPLHILDKMKDFNNLGIDVFRIYFSTENPQECSEIYSAYVNNLSINLDFTRGLYYRGVL